jgi:hypothetical protein
MKPLSTGRLNGRGTRMEPSSAEAEPPAGGSHYSNQTIDHFTKKKESNYFLKILQN